MKHTYIDLFCGSGGFSLGFEQAGYKQLFSNEIEKSFSETYTHNFPKHKLIIDDIKKITEEKIDSIIGSSKVDIIIGGPPCQGFSMAGNIGRKFLIDPRNKLFLEFYRIVNFLKPKIFIIENVERLFIHNKGETIKEINRKFNSIGYKISNKIINTYEYGIPQKRRRLFILGTLGNKKLDFPKSIKKRMTIYDAIEDLPKIESGQAALFPSNHESMKHTQQMLNKMKYIKDGGNRMDIPLKIRPTSGDSRKYIRYKSTEPSFAVTGDMRKIFHYTQNRALTVRELARIQTFPDDFVFKGNKISQQLQVGNAVPPLLAKKIANHIKKYL